MKHRAILLGLLTIALLCGACKQGAQSLTLLVWEGYADESFANARADWAELALAGKPGAGELPERALAAASD